MTDRTNVPEEEAEADATLAPEAAERANMLTLEICFLAFVGLVVLLAFFEALTYQLVSSRTPFVIMVPLFILIAVHASRLYRHRDEADFGGRIRRAMAGRMPGLNKVLQITLWLVGMLVLIVAVGHYLGLGIFCFGLMWRVGGVPLKTSLLVSVASMVVIFLVFELAFDLELYRGLSFRWLAGYRDF